MRLPSLALVLTVLAGCAASNAPPPATCETRADCGAGMICMDNVCRPEPTGDADAGTVPIPVGLSSIVIEPSNAELVSENGATVEQLFSVVGVFDDGRMGPVMGPRFEIESIGIGLIDEASGRFSGNGVIGGTARVTATLPGSDFRAEATITVRVSHTTIAPGAPAGVAELFSVVPVVDAVRSANIVYPLDGAVMPQNVYPADVQWVTGLPGDIFQVRIAKPHAVVNGYVSHTGSGFGFHWLVDETAWRSIAQTDPEVPATVDVDRWDSTSSEVVSSETVSVRFARAALTGSVYYWDIAAGRIVRIDDGTAERHSFMPTPPAAMRGEVCVGCHTVSNSGRYMAGRLGGGENVGGVFDLTLDLSGNPPPTVYPIRTAEPTSQRWWFSSWSPDDRRMVLSTNEGTTRAMRFMDPFTGAEVPVSGTLPMNTTHPAWSPDGSAIAYVTNIDTWGGQNQTGDIAVIPVVGPDAVGTPSVVHRGADLSLSTPRGVADSYPSWAPDSQRIAFAHGSGSRSEDQSSALYVMGRDGSAVTRLDRANGGPGTTNNFQPNYSPFDSGGYYWLSFLSRRDYGNTPAGTRGRNIQQIWVTAIRKDAAPGDDPSEVAYWLPGQNTGSRNISAYWAPRACRPDGESCSVGTECCGGDCRPDMSGASVCAPPPPERCRDRYETCSSGGDCCGELVCFGNVCIDELL